jgi:hemerythrin superfamily protein
MRATMRSDGWINPGGWEQRAASSFEPVTTQETVMAKAEYTDAIALLKADHRTVEELFEKFEKASGDGRKQAIAEQICTELKIHSMIEEEIFYPALDGKIEEDMLKEAYVEHDGAKVLINDIMAGGPDDEYYDSKVSVLQEEIEHHVGEEEMPKEGMFAQAREADVDLVALRDQMLARKEELMAQAEAGGLPPAQLTAVQTSAT